MKKMKKKVLNFSVLSSIVLGVLFSSNPEIVQANVDEEVTSVMCFFEHDQNPQIRHRDCRTCQWTLGYPQNDASGCELN